jgi:acyl carrier protein
MTVGLTAAVDQFAREVFFYDGPPLDRDTRLIESGVIDSTGVLELVSFLEERFGIRIEDSEIAPEQLDSVARIEALITRKQREASRLTRPPSSQAGRVTPPPGAGP